MANHPFISLVNGSRAKLNPLRHGKPASFPKKSFNTKFQEVAKAGTQKDTFVTEKKGNQSYVDLLRGIKA